jgi:lysozyme
MKLTKAGLDLIKSSEGLRLVAYYCPAGVLTVGYGHTSAAGAPFVKAGMKITEQEAEDILKADLVKYEDAVKRLVHVPINDNQYSALVSLCYNIGEGNLSKSTVIARVNQKDWEGAAKAFLLWNRSKGVVLKGLETRRKQEADLFLAPVSDNKLPADRPTTGVVEAIINAILSIFKVSK